jgi:malate dehydrogenase (oxaloacetate-decarboxylating)(NADP+)
MFLAAAQALSAQILPEEIAAGSIYPSINRVREVSVAIAVAVCQVAKQAGLVEGNLPEANLAGYITAQMYDPQYRVS